MRDAVELPTTELGQQMCKVIVRVLAKKGNLLIELIAMPRKDDH